MTLSRSFGKSTAERAFREQQRLDVLNDLDLLDAPKDVTFERIVRLIQQIFSVDIGIVSIIDAHRQWYQACNGLPVSEVAREETFCRHVVESEEPLIVQDASQNPRFCDNPSVTGEAHIRFYAGIPLKTNQGFILGTVCAIDRAPKSFGNKDLAIMQELAALAMDRIELLQSAATDGLTGVMTRKAFKAEAAKLISQAVRHQHGLSCMVLDIDHFKKVNDTLGHAAGDEVLKAVSAACKNALRAGDIIGRLGGEEFAILLPHTDKAAAAAVAEKIRACVTTTEVKCPGKLSVTASLGTTNLSIVSRDIDSLLAQADAAMYAAKSGGRNRCVSWHTMSNADGQDTRRRVLKSGSIQFNDRQSTIDCTIKTLGSNGAGLVVTNTANIPSEFRLLIKGEGFETRCRVISQDRQNIEVAFA